MTSHRVRLRPEIESIVPYRQGRTAAEDAFKLSSNENPYPPLPAVTAALSQSSINRYPEASAAGVRGMIGAKFGISPEQVQVGAGSVAVLAQLISAASAPGDEVLYAWRSFEAYPLLVATAGSTSVQVPLTSDGRHDLDAMAAAVTDRTRVAIVCSPNNPTGTAVTRDEFERFMAAVPSTVLVLLDEAYAEFVTDPDAVRGEELLDRYPNLVVLRTFSKAYGLAGLRIGYAIGAEYIMDAARAVAIPLSVTEPAQRAAMVSLENEPDLLDRVARLAALRDEVVAGLTAQGWSIPAPQGNFVWLETGEHTMDAVGAFERHGIIVRPLGGGVRVTIGEDEAVANLLKAAEEVVSMQRTDGSGSGLG
ncbi:histidinol-phosphate aminotransferase [Microbacteriaceae bacterium SG_E_30_P1]|uniref:Aromatic amino acid aminotransferase n=1 Tax=Antiquaquibacter oligotrophicus TaxID=2880260 RepID=A0ABT6KTJ8_9MICO|nr:histidinol-phosphate transaminase [Antiquaquibacter oligotrophicus]MDH6182397.1 histidinol-phosphate aminotransferase [Antiquaquibacter oligotrophicus]UDF14630.1 histidinol-phosphate transaminase [Antiquaquibacter oligotrophicus]